MHSSRSFCNRSRGLPTEQYRAALAGKSIACNAAGTVAGSSTSTMLTCQLAPGALPFRARVLDLHPQFKFKLIVIYFVIGRRATTAHPPCTSYTSDQRVSQINERGVYSSPPPDLESPSSVPSFSLAFGYPPTPFWMVGTWVTRLLSEFFGVE
jgi:hypothetical protein